MNPNPEHLATVDRLKSLACIHCGCGTGPRDHVPSKVILDEPYPPDLPVVDTYEACNQGLLLNKQNLVCFLECVIHGATDPDALGRARAARMLRELPDLRSRIQLFKRETLWGELLWNPEVDRVKKLF